VYLTREVRPDLIVPPETFEAHLCTISEIYPQRAKTYISNVLDAVFAG